MDEAEARSGSEVRNQAVVVISAGDDTDGRLRFMDLLARLRRSSKRGARVKVFTVAFGSRIEPEVMRRIAEETRGKFVLARPGQLTEACAEVATLF
jgi:hypothetical protein